MISQISLRDLTDWLAVSTRSQPAVDAILMMSGAPGAMESIPAVASDDPLDDVFDLFWDQAAADETAPDSGWHSSEIFFAT